MTSHGRLRSLAISGMAILILLLSPISESFAQSPGYPCWGVGSWMMGGPWGWMGGIMMLLFWGLVLIGLVLLIRWLAAAGDSRRQLSATLPESPVEILKKRYARGEITKEQFESMRRDLE